LNIVIPQLKKCIILSSHHLRIFVPSTGEEVRKRHRERGIEQGFNKMRHPFHGLYLSNTFLSEVNEI